MNELNMSNIVVELAVLLTELRTANRKLQRDLSVQARDAAKERKDHDLLVQDYNASRLQVATLRADLAHTQRQLASALRRLKKAQTRT